MAAPFENESPRSGAAWEAQLVAHELDALDLDIPPFDTPAIDAARNLISTLIGGKPRNLAIIGESGIGKSTVAEKVVNACRKFLGREMHSNAILQVRLASKATIASLAEDILGLVGDPHFGRRVDPGIAERRIITMLKGRKVKVVVIDEAHHLLHGKGAKGRYHLAESLKNIGDMAGVVFIFVGTPELIDLMQQNKQFARRVRTLVRLRPFDWNDPDGRDNLLLLLHSIDVALGFKELAGFDLPDLAFRIYQAVSGIPGATIEFLVEVGKFAREQRKKRIELEDLQAVYLSSLGSHRVGSQNPFADSIPANWKPVSPGYWFQDDGPGRD